MPLPSSEAQAAKVSEVFRNYLHIYRKVQKEARRIS